MKDSYIDVVDPGDEDENPKIPAVNGSGGVVDSLRAQLTKAKQKLSSDMLISDLMSAPPPPPPPPPSSNQAEKQEPSTVANVTCLRCGHLLLWHFNGDKEFKTVGRQGLQESPDVAPVPASVSNQIPPSAPDLVPAAPEAQKVCLVKDWKMYQR